MAHLPRLLHQASHTYNQEEGVLCRQRHDLTYCFIGEEVVDRSQCRVPGLLKRLGFEYPALGQHDGMYHATSR